MSARQLLGQHGEDLVAAHLEREGFAILARNVRVGRLELDLVAMRKRMVVICEVRTRFTDSLLDPIETIDAAKVERVRRAAAQWLAAKRLPIDEIRFDAASVVLDGDAPSIRYFEEAF